MGPPSGGAAGEVGFGGLRRAEVPQPGGDRQVVGSSARLEGMPVLAVALDRAELGPEPIHHPDCRAWMHLVHLLGVAPIIAQY